MVVVKPGLKENTEVGGVMFNNKEGMVAWVESKLPVNLPYVYFVDVYSFLDIFLQVSGGLKNLEIKHKLGLSGDETLSLSIL